MWDLLALHGPKEDKRPKQNQIVSPVSASLLSVMHLEERSLLRRGVICYYVRLTPLGDKTELMMMFVLHDGKSKNATHY